MEKLKISLSTDDMISYIRDYKIPTSKWLHLTNPFRNQKDTIITKI